MPFSASGDALLAAFRAGAPEAYEALYLRYAPSLHTFVQLYTNADTADDIVHDVFLALWNRRATLEFRDGIRAYLFGAARLAALQNRRNAGIASRYRTARPHDLEFRIPADTPEQLALRQEIQTAVAHAIATLPERTRELLALRWAHGLSYPEAAAVLGISAEAAKKLGRRAEVVLAPLLERFRST